MRRTLLATASVLVLLTASPARADLGMGEMTQAVSDGVEDWFEELFDSLCQWLDALAELPEMALPTPPVAPSDEHATADPTTTEAAVEYQQQRLDERLARVEAVDAAAKAAAATSQQTTVTMTTLNAANVSPISPVAVGQIGNAMTATAVTEQMASNQILANMAAMQADQALREERGRVEAWETTKAQNPDGLWTGIRYFKPETLKLDF